MKKKFYILLACLLIFPLLAESVWAKVYIDIRSPSFRKFPIAISPFKAPISPNEDLKFGERATEILNNDLTISGFFALIDPRTFAENTVRGQPSGLPSGPGPTPGAPGAEAIDFRPLANIGA